MGFKIMILRRSEVVDTEVQIKLEADPVEVHPGLFEVSFFQGYVLCISIIPPPPLRWLGGGWGGGG